jgi:hypothetical protein
MWGEVPEIPDYAYDKHTMKGKRLGRGANHFRKEGAKLENRKSETKDDYEDHAYRNWLRKEGSTGKTGPAKKATRKRKSE